jgi:hypothetical protein
MTFQNKEDVPTRSNLGAVESHVSLLAPTSSRTNRSHAPSKQEKGQNHGRYIVYEQAPFPPNT